MYATRQGNLTILLRQLYRFTGYLRVLDAQGSNGFSVGVLHGRSDRERASGAPRVVLLTARAG